MQIPVKDVYDYLFDKGLPYNSIIGILANIKGESAFNPGVQEVSPTHGRGGYGLFQHTGPRRRALEQYCADRDVPTNDWKTQIDFALGEHDSVAYKKIVFDSPEEASDWWCKRWERPRDADFQAKKRRYFIPLIRQQVALGK